MNFLQGKKTYLIALGIVLYEILGYLLGKSPSIDVKTMLEAAGLAALRAGITKGD